MTVMDFLSPPSSIVDESITALSRPMTRRQQSDDSEGTLSRAVSFSSTIVTMTTDTLKRDASLLQGSFLPLTFK